MSEKPPASAKKKLKARLAKFPLLLSFAQTINRLEQALVQQSGPPLLRLLSLDHTSRIQKILKKTFVKKIFRFFIQVGSNDGILNDPLHDLIVQDSHWTGVFIEPVGFLFERLKETCLHSDRYVFENVAIGTTRGKRKFYFISEAARTEFNDALPCWVEQFGSFDKNHLLKHMEPKLHPYILETEIDCVPLQEIFDRNNIKSLDLFHIDAEGFDYQVLSQLNDILKPKMRIFEYGSGGSTVFFAG